MTQRRRRRQGTISLDFGGMGSSVQQIERLMGTRGDIIRKCPPPSARYFLMTLSPSCVIFRMPFVVYPRFIDMREGGSEDP